MQATRDLKTVQQILRLEASQPSDARLQDCVLLCIDCEAYEDDHSKITELGIAMLEPREICGLSWGESGDEWFKRIKARHCRLLEHRELVNRKYVQGREEFFNFGESEWVSIPTAAKILASAMSTPQLSMREAEADQVVDKDFDKIVIVGHDLRSDKKFLSNLGFSWTTSSNVVWTIDTQRMPGSTKKAPISLSRLLLALGIEARNLHNAGNDAVYTLQALLKMAVMESQTSGSVFTAIQQSKGVKDNGSAERSDSTSSRLLSGGADPKATGEPKASSDRMKPAKNVSIPSTEPQMVSRNGKRHVEDAEDALEPSRKRPAV